MLDPNDIKRFLRGELIDPERAVDILLAAESDPELSLWLDLFVPKEDDQDEPPARPAAAPTSPRRPRT